jgi:hypothetical protein
METTPKMKKMIFTSAGNNTNFHNIWISENQEYDIYVVYYGDNETLFNEYREKSTFAIKNKGSKFQNFYYFYNNYREIVDSYDLFLIIDDDIVIESSDINKLFDISIKYNLSICQPSFKVDKLCKITYPITRNKKNTLLTYTNFIEVNAPLFNKEALIKLMEKYDPVLIGWGIDYLYIQINGMNKKDSYAVIHEVSCINPTDDGKIICRRELNLIPDVKKRRYFWENYAEKNGYLKQIKPVSYLDIPL